MISGYSIKKFIKELGSRNPSPGGGSVSALTAALSLALLSMVLHFTISNKKYAKHQKQARRILSKIMSYQKEFIGLVDVDAHAYAHFAELFKKRKICKINLEEEYKNIIAPQFKICQNIFSIIPFFIQAKKIYNKNMRSDFDISILLLKTSFYSANLTIKCSLSYMHDRCYTSRVEKFIRKINKTINQI